MLRAIKATVFGPSRAARRRAVSTYIGVLEKEHPGETFNCAFLAADYGRFSVAHGSPPLDADAVLRELVALGFNPFTAIKLSEAQAPRGGPLLPPMDEPKVDLAQPQPRRLRRAGGAPGRKFSRGRALTDLLERLGTGEVIPSQNALAERWNIDKGTVSKWLKDWDANGRIPPRAREGRCNIIYLPVEQRQEAA